ncbi:MAG: hypothetical protein FWJ62_06900 [Thermaerobacter sp.]|nr:hypothetical protein [Bacillota bacterium]REJ36579.1 MAG: hypothetical protein DIU84_05695 [Bacillota bacterium]
MKTGRIRRITGLACRAGMPGITRILAIMGTPGFAGIEPMLTRVLPGDWRRQRYGMMDPLLSRWPCGRQNEAASSPE